MKIKTKAEWNKILEEALDEDYAEVMSDFVKENPTEEVTRIVNTFPVLDAAVAWMEQFKETLKQNGQDVSKLDEYNIGWLIYFFEKTCGISGYLLGVNPFNQPGVEVYKKNMFHLLGKKGY